MTRRQLKAFPAILIIIAAAILLLSTGACGEGDGGITLQSEVTAPQEESGNTVEFEETKLQAIQVLIGDEVDVEGITRFYDPEAHVWCWIYDGGWAGGMACLPSSEVGMRRPR